MTGIVLAGGKSTRLGQDKAVLLLGEQTLLERVVAALAQVADDIVVVVAPGQDPARVPAHPLVRQVHDLHRERGPLAGLYAGLLAAHSPYAWVVGCDMPFLNPGLLRYLMEQAQGYDAVVPLVSGWAHGVPEGLSRPQTLHAVYSRRCLPVLDHLLAGGQAALYDLLPRIQVRYVDNAEVEPLDPLRLSFLNINDQDDLALARRLLRPLEPPP